MSVCVGGGGGPGGGGCPWRLLCTAGRTGSMATGADRFAPYHIAHRGVCLLLAADGRRGRRAIIIIMPVVSSRSLPHPSYVTGSDPPPPPLRPP